MSEFNNIGIDGKLDWKRIKKLLSIGLFAGIITFASDWILGYGLADESLSGIGYMLSKYTGRSDSTLFWSGLLGLIGITLEGLCFFGIYRLMAEKSPKHAHLYRTGIIGYLVFGPCGVHVPCVAMVYVYNHILGVDAKVATNLIYRYVVYFLAPATILFFLFYVILCYAQISAFVKELTPYPKWCWIFCLPVGMVIAIFFKVLGNYAFVNAILTAWISVGNIWMFGGLLLMMSKAKDSKVK